MISSDELRFILESHIDYGERNVTKLVDACADLDIRHWDLDELVEKIRREKVRINTLKEVLNYLYSDEVNKAK